MQGGARRCKLSSLYEPSRAHRALAAPFAYKLSLLRTGTPFLRAGFPAQQSLTSCITTCLVAEPAVRGGELNTSRSQDAAHICPTFAGGWPCQSELYSHQK